VLDGRYWDWLLDAGCKTAEAGTSPAVEEEERRNRTLELAMNRSLAWGNES